MSPPRRARSILLLLAWGVALSGCTSAGNEPSAATASARHPGATGSGAACSDAPAWLVTAVQGTIAARGATISRVTVTVASHFETGPPAVFEPAFADAWWVAAMVSGAGVRPEVATWVTNRTSALDVGDIYAADGAARRDSTASPPGNVDITGPGDAEARSCVGPIPEA